MYTNSGYRCRSQHERTLYRQNKKQNRTKTNGRKKRYDGSTKNHTGIWLYFFVLFCFDSIFDHHLHFPAQLVGGFTLSNLLDKSWSQVSSPLPSGTCLHFLSRIGFSIPSARRFSSNVANSTLSRFPLIIFLCKKKSLRVCALGENWTRGIDFKLLIGTRITYQATR